METVQTYLFIKDELDPVAYVIFSCLTRRFTNHNFKVFHAEEDSIRVAAAFIPLTHTPAQLRTIKRILKKHKVIPVALTTDRELFRDLVITAGDDCELCESASNKLDVWFQTLAA